MVGVKVCLLGFALVVSFGCFTFPATAQTTDPSEVTALQTIKTRLIDQMKHLNNWNKGDPCTSNWTGVLCFDTVGIDGYLHIRELQLLNMNLSGYLAPELGQLSHIQVLDFMWNEITGNIPKEIGNITSLELLLLNGNKISGSLPAEIGYLPNLDRLQVDQNQLSGPIPNSFSNLNRIKHLHLNNNSLSGQIPPELSKLSSLLHLLLDNNNLSGYLPPELSNILDLRILQLDNNHFNESEIPASYKNMSKLVKLSLRNCSLQGAIPDLSSIPHLHYLDLSWNELTGSIPSNKLSDRITTIDLSHNHLNGSIPANFSVLPHLQRLSLENNLLSGSVPSTIWENMTFTSSASLTLDLRNNSLSNILGDLHPPTNVSIRLQGNPVCNNVNKRNMVQFCQSEARGEETLVNFGPQGSMISKRTLALLLFGAITCAIMIPAAIAMLIAKRKFRHHPSLSSKHLSSKISIKIDGVKVFKFKEMVLATDNFNISTQVGQGGYGKVYKGILEDNTVVAIKRAEEGSLQGQKEFLTEIELLSRLHHRNLVSLIGYCVEQGEQMLIYEFMPNGTLRDWLCVKAKERLSFGMRLHIALGSARGILYLHTEANPPIYHRDIKASNILLDSKLNAKVADFGLSRLAPVPDEEGMMPGHISTIVKGTPGYLDPEYLLTHKLTDKSDVYSLGVVFLELLTGMRPISHGKNIVREVNVAYQSGMTHSILDKCMGSYPSKCIEKFVVLALKCCMDKPEARPSMSEVVRKLESILQMLSESDTMLSECTYPNSGISAPPSSLTCVTRDPNLSSNVSGSDLVSGVIPTIRPR
ncbi:PREDICTED: probable LRR receptor-like serine/threonine-protein kinase At1g06840 isoform X3 [Nelumbo nucifera]|uniref:non-specific serine/threonine protein kinase n=1 Tax=Nelumbo nucifera TaxID=4432 RepID=A0A1U7YYD8_NELNU|nr:PREDICTED: probable LRR receptor-like serine/threonine-protein kinase At1g06840 isoform X3 [Nelumbo nucifera]